MRKSLLCSLAALALAPSPAWADPGSDLKALVDEGAVKVVGALYDIETGKVTFAAFLARMNRCYREQLRDLVVMANQEGTRVAAEYVVHGEYLADDTGLPPARGQKYVLPGGAFFDIRDGRIARVTNYYNLEDWIAQVSE